MKLFKKAAAHVIVNDKETKIYLDELTYGELVRRIYHCLENSDFETITTKNLKLGIVDMDQQAIQSDEDVRKAFEKDIPTLKVIWRNCGQKKMINNALVIMIAISEYNKETDWPNLENVKDRDLENFKKLFKDELKYDFICNESPKMLKPDVEEFLDAVIANYKLRENSNKYDALIIILCGHDCPKIFIVDACRGRNRPKSRAVVVRGNQENIQSEQFHGHDDDGFLTIWSTTKGHLVSDASLLSQCMHAVMTEAHKKNYSLNQMLREIRDKIRKNQQGEWYCVESQDTTLYDIVFTPNSR
ncbi:hypothetical protein RFI_29694 [Reticulomyxa filosa]|uniref:Caspase family p20 domain-containing protein n=1 Tax=Reticulomyxa filosa TaxID=46433 RepID=X6M3U0_RETFI|nr:hypothetical protein RFI_29694 [Reticulomyxa filosa]|eukprot:ETO07695.1 hypothetical protein RFI_29694 [Reticulomyxa filosa]